MSKRSSQDPASVNDLSMRALENQNQQIDKAIALLEKGKWKKAELLIEEVLILNPKHTNAALLKSQLNQSYDAVFNTTKTFTYQVKSGDSLGKIAQQWLGNSLYFVSLAKLNKIKNPSLLSPGAKIKVPLNEVAQASKKQIRRSKANLNLLKQYRKKGQVLAGLKKANSLYILNRDYSMLYHEQQLLLDEYAKRSTDTYAKRHMLKNVREIATSARNKKQKEIYTRFIKAQNRILVIAESQELFQNEEYIEAAEKLIEAKKLDKNITRQSNVFRMENSLVNKLHEQAIVFYRNHALDKALGRWELILKLNPDHALANKYKVRTERLLKKLDQY